MSCYDHVSYQTSLQLAWVVGGRALARGIKRACVRCRYLAKQLLDQQMSVLPAHLSLPCPCFSYVAVDLCVPVEGVGCAVGVLAGEGCEDISGGGPAHRGFLVVMGQLCG